MRPLRIETANASDPSHQENEGQYPEYQIFNSVSVHSEWNGWTSMLTLDPDDHAITLSSRNVIAIQFSVHGASLVGAAVVTDDWDIESEKAVPQWSNLLVP
jgi:hypothetical protein